MPVMGKTQKLGIEVDLEKNRKDSIPTRNVSRKIDSLLVKWFRHFKLNGRGLIVGDGGYCQHIKKSYKHHFPEIEEMRVVDLEDADIIWDITEPRPVGLMGMDWVVFQATLEHVYDPVASIKNLISTLKTDGLLYLHTVGPGMKVHRRPVDCLRFLPDFFTILEQKNDHIEIVDMLWTNYHVNVLFRRL